VWPPDWLTARWLWQVRNAFRPTTIRDLRRAFAEAQDDTEIVSPPTQLIKGPNSHCMYVAGRLQLSCVSNGTHRIRHAQQARRACADAHRAAGHLCVCLQGVIILTGQGSEAFCSGGDQSLRGEGGCVCVGFPL
jgi:1,4-dihydroxy-2-naphthoyl-CoA synthase